MDERFTPEFWDDRYGSATRIWSGDPNPQLVAETAELPPGTALDAGCGEGADAHWLAGRGWRVTAMDVSAVALSRGAAHVEGAVADRISWECVDLTGWVPDGRTYDLVSAQFLQFPPALRDPLFAGLAASVAPAGTLLVVGHHPGDMRHAGHRHHEPELFFTAEQIAATLDPAHWEVLAADSRARAVRDAEGRETTFHDAVLRARRRP